MPVDKLLSASGAISAQRRETPRYAKIQANSRIFESHTVPLGARWTMAWANPLKFKMDASLTRASRDSVQSRPFPDLQNTASSKP